MWLNKDYLRRKGVYSICSSNIYVIEAALEVAKEKDDYILIEVTPHQVNQYGGYSGMTPEDFKNLVRRLVKEKDIGEERVILGGDHIGPLPWQKESSSMAMKKAKELVKAFIESGYQKIHIDCSMPLGDDPYVLGHEVIAKRSRELIEVAEETAKNFNLKPVYIIGTDVPKAGGGEEEGITTVEEFKKSITAFKRFFKDMPWIWDRIVGFVIMLGIGFNYDSVFPYERERTREIIKEVLREGLFVEAHSTDYQTKESLKNMVEDGIRILKVGPALTSAFRRAVFLLSVIEDEFIEKNKRSDIKNVLLDLMLKDDKHWKNYYKESDNIKFDIWYNLLDRVRYYWEYKPVKEALDILIKNFSSGIDMRFIYQYFYDSYFLIRDGKLRNDPVDLVKYEIKRVLDDYHFAINI